MYKSLLMYNLCNVNAVESFYCFMFHPSEIVLMIHYTNADVYQETVHQFIALLEADGHCAGSRKKALPATP